MVSPQNGDTRGGPPLPPLPSRDATVRCSKQCKLELRNWLILYETMINFSELKLDLWFYQNSLQFLVLC